MSDRYPDIVLWAVIALGYALAWALFITAGVLLAQAFANV